MKYGYGVDLGGTTVKIAYFDETGNMIEKWEIPTVTADGGKQILSDIAASIADHRAKQNHEILGIGIGVPGPVNGQGEVSVCVNLGWGRFNVSQALSQLVGLPVVAGNDANVAAMGEFWKGGGQGCRNMIFVTLGTGVGGGVIIEGRLLHGTTGAGAEIGHMVLNREETVACNCGKKGCAEQYCSATGLVRMAKDYESAKAVFDAANAGDEQAKAVLEQYFAYLAELIANVCIVLNPEKVVIGGGVSKAGQPLLDGIARHFTKYIYHSSRDMEFALAALGNDAGAYGAFKLLLD